MVNIASMNLIDLTQFTQSLHLHINNIAKIEYSYFSQVVSNEVVASVFDRFNEVLEGNTAAPSGHTLTLMLHGYVSILVATNQKENRSFVTKQTEMAFKLVCDRLALERVPLDFLSANLLLQACYRPRKYRSNTAEMQALIAKGESYAL